MIHRTAPLLGLAAVLLASACTDTGSLPAEPDETIDEDLEDEPRVAQFHEDVRPILIEHCGSCHAQGSIAPFTLDSYEDAREWGEPMLAAIQARTMPPFAVNNDGSCNDFADARWLSDEDIETIAQWVDGGFPEGDASIPPPPMPELPALTGSITELTLPQYEPRSSSGDFEDYHCFELALDLEEPRYITGFDVIPGNPSLVHHVLGFRVIPSLLGNATQMQALDEQSPDVPGWECFGAAGEDVLPSGVPVTWAPGAGAIEFPADTGVRVDPGDVLVVQVHYDLVGGTGFDTTTVQLSMVDEVGREAHQILWDPFLFSGQFGEPEELAAGEETASFSWDNEIREMLVLDTSGADQLDEIELLGILPHMHQRGRRMSIELETEAGMQCGADVDRWDFNWQNYYFFEQSIGARMGDRIHVTCEWNTMGDTTPVQPGFGTDDEMCLVGLMFTAR